jgi:hypothetical protein
MLKSQQSKIHKKPHFLLTKTGLEVQKIKNLFVFFHVEKLNYLQYCVIIITITITELCQHKRIVGTFERDKFKFIFTNFSSTLIGVLIKLVQIHSGPN